MTAMNTRYVVSVEDLRFVTILCRHCNTRISLDLDAEFESAGRKPFDSPRECPRCHNPFDSAVPRAINEMQKVYKALANLGNTVTFAGDAAAAPKP